MNKKVLVIGSVTTYQYQRVRLQVIAAGDKPEIIRVNPADFLLDADQLHLHYAPTHEFVDGPSGANPSDQLRKFAEKHLANYGGSNIAAIICDTATWNKWAMSRGAYSPIDKQLARLGELTWWIAFANGTIERAPR